MSLADTIRSERERRGLSKSAAAKSVGVSAAYWDKMEKGGSVPTVDVAARIGRVLELPAKVFFETSETLTPGEMDKALEQQTKQLLGTRYNDDSILVIKRFKYKEKKAVLRLLSQVGEVNKNGQG